MANPKARGRIITKEISGSKGFASLSPQSAVLFCMMIPHFNAHGKLNGGPGYIKDEVCPHISYLTTKTIPKYLKEISDKTNVKWFQDNGRCWIHSINFLSEHQNLKDYRSGPDLLPNYSCTSPAPVQEQFCTTPAPVLHQSCTSAGAVPPKDEVKDKDKVKDKGKSCTTPALPDFINPELFKDYIEMRNKIKKPPTDKAINLAIKTLEKLKDEGQNPNSVLEQSILNSWQGLFAVKKEKTKKGILDD